MKKTILGAELTFLFCAVILAACGNSNSAGPNPAEGMRVATLSGNPSTTMGGYPTPVPATTMIPPQNNLNPSILLQDDFSHPSSGWEVSKNDYGRTAYEQGGYLVEAYLEKEYYWGVAGVDYSDVRIDVEVSVLQTIASGNDAFGVDCRIQENGDGYGFRISSDGFAGIVMFLDGKGSSLVDWIKSDAITSEGTNTLNVICRGNELQLRVNGVYVATVTDDTFSHGDIALSAIAYEPGTISTLFDNITVQDLEDLQTNSGNAKITSIKNE